ncbi:MAG: non-heme iron oxygenase ferredoxin subunit [Chromatiaceae bacterium]|nr:non-heme iron oxygenase ferredoxin subunit [Chromatiaceae bacterium]
MDNNFMAVAEVEAIAPGRFIKVEAGGVRCLIAQVEGRFYAVEDNCSHEDYPLSYGCLDGDRIKCSLHGSRFRLSDGAPLDAPADTPIRTFRVRVAEGQVWIDPTQAAD